MHSKMLRPDSKGRVTLGTLAKGVSGYEVSEEPDGRILLTPYVEIPAKEKWLFENKEALTKVKRGIEQSKAGKLVDRGSFSKHLNDV